MFRPSLLTALLLSACAPTLLSTHQTTPLRRGDNAEMRIHVLTPTNLYDHPTYAVRVGDTTLVPRVPLPAFALQITNKGDEPIYLDDVKAWVTDRADQRYGLLINREDIVRRTVEDATLVKPDKRPSQVTPRFDRTDAIKLSPAEIEAAARTIPVLGSNEATSIPPGYTWSGAAVLAGDAERLAPLQRLLVTDRLTLHLVGVRVGTQALPASAHEFFFELPTTERVVHCSDGRDVGRAEDCGEVSEMATVLDGTCIQENVSSSMIFGRRIAAPFVDAQPSTTTEVTRILMQEPETKRQERHSWRIKIAGWVLLTGGTILATGTVSGFGLNHHSDIASVGLGFLGFTAIGIPLIVVAQREHLKVVRQYNRIAYRSGLCPHGDERARWSPSQNANSPGPTAR